MNKTKWTIIGLALGLILIISSIFYLTTIQSSAGKAIRNLEQIDLAINMFPNSALVHIAQEKGFFTEQGLKVNYHPFSTGKLALDALLGNSVNIATTADVPITLAGLANQPLSVIATIEYSTDNIQVVARKDSGILKPADLIGKKVATTQGGGPMFFEYKFLQKNNISLDKVKTVYLSPPDMITALVRKDIDAFIVFEPSPSIVKKTIGLSNLTIFSPTDIYGETWNIVVMQDYASNHPGTIKKFIKALIKAEKFYNENRDASYDIVSNYSETKKELLINILEKQKIGVVLNQILLTDLDEEATWAIKQGLSPAKTAPDFRSLISTSYLNSLDENKVTI